MPPSHASLLTIFIFFSDQVAMLTTLDTTITDIMVIINFMYTFMNK